MKPLYATLSIVAFFLAGATLPGAMLADEGGAAGNGAPLIGASSLAAVDAPEEGSPYSVTNPFPKPPPPSTKVRVALLNASGQEGHGIKIGVLLGELKRKSLEEKIGMRITMANISRTRPNSSGVNVVYYRPHFLKAALLIAKEIPGEQKVYPMSPEQISREGIDVNIVLGGR